MALYQQGRSQHQPGVTSETTRKLWLDAITWKYDFIQQYKKQCFQFAEAVIIRIALREQDVSGKNDLIEQFIEKANKLPEANRFLLDQMYELAWNVIYPVESWQPCDRPHLQAGRCRQQPVRAVVRYRFHTGRSCWFGWYCDCRIVWLGRNDCIWSCRWRRLGSGRNRKLCRWFSCFRRYSTGWFGWTRRIGSGSSWRCWSWH